MLAANTSSTPPGGLIMPLHSVRDLGSNESSAAMAASTAGSAFARSSAVDLCFSPTSFWITATNAASFSALAVSPSTNAFSLPTTSAMPSAFVFLTSASSSVIFRPASISATASAVSCIFWRPAFKRPIE